jgi:purine-binding chemotaxis protein CheW
MGPSNQLVVFTLDDQSYALALSCVERIVRAVEITHVPEASENVLGVINIEGRVIPVINTRRRLGLPEREIGIQDLFIILHDGSRSLAMVADEVKPVVEIPGQDVVASGNVLPEARFVQGVAKLDEGMIVILGAERALSSSEYESLSSMLDRGPS